MKRLLLVMGGGGGDAEVQTRTDGHFSFGHCYNPRRRTQGRRQESAGCSACRQQILKRLGQREHKGNKCSS